MKEELLHYVWKFQCFDKKGIKCNNGDTLQILNPGRHNQDAGPDFLEAKIKLNDTIWAGNIEIHVHQSDWKKHQHQDDPKYQNIILHVCYFMDETLPELDSIAPTLVLNGNVKPSLLGKYRLLNENKRWIPCESIIKPIILQEQIPLFAFPLVLNRIERKCKDVQAIFHQQKSDWEATNYVLIAQSFGSRVNKFGFEQLAKATPYKVLMKHSTNLFQLEAILLGQAALLPKNSEEDYVNDLIKEYDFLKKKYKLTPLQKTIWNYAKLRPANFPDIKIVQWANFIHQFPKAFTSFIELEDVNQFYKTKIEASEYWNTHYRIGKDSIKRKKKLSKSFLNILLINAATPLIFFYGLKNKDNARSEQALNILEQIPAEQNSIIKKWKELGYQAGNALESQALLELKNEYCDNIACLKCRIGMKLLNS